MKKTALGKGFLSVCACVILTFILVTCANEDKYAGIYIPLESRHPDLVGLTVQFKKNGIGVRHFRGEEVFFEWESKGDEIRIYTREGGTILGKPKNGVLEIAMPGPVIYFFNRISTE